MCVCAWICTGTHAYVEARSQHQVSLPRTFHLLKFLQGAQGLSLEIRLPSFSRPGLMGKPPGSPHLCPITPRFQTCAAMPSFYMADEDLNSGLYACAAGILPWAISPALIHSFVIIFSKYNFHHNEHTHNTTYTHAHARTLAHTHTPGFCSLLRYGKYMCPYNCHPTQYRALVNLKILPPPPTPAKPQPQCMSVGSCLPVM